MCIRASTGHDQIGMDLIRDQEHLVFHADPADALRLLCTPHPVSYTHLDVYKRQSPLFGKEKMTTLERYLIKDPAAHRERKNPYYRMVDNVEVVNQIFNEFGLDPSVSHIINGHIPVRIKDGETPIKCGGRLLVIDGGFSKAYQSQTGIAGYTLVYNSYGLRLVAHKPFESTEAAIINESDIHSDSFIVQQFPARRLVADTDNGKLIQESITELEALQMCIRDSSHSFYHIRSQQKRSPSPRLSNPKFSS